MLSPIDQIPVVVGASSYQAVKLYQGKRVLSTSQGAEGANWRVDKLVFYCASGIAAGLVAGLLGLGGGFIMGPLFLEMGITPHVSSFLLPIFHVMKYEAGFNSVKS